MPHSQRKGRLPVAPPSRVVLIGVSIAALAAFVALAIGDIVTSAPTSDETSHLVAGYSYLVTHDYRLNPEHPPLLKKLAALPLLGMPVWPARFHDAADGPATFALVREAWAMAVPNPAMAEWSVSQYILYGLRDAALHRVGGGALKPPTDALYARSDFLNDPEGMFLRGRLMMLLVGLALGVAIFVWSYSIWGLEGATISLLLFCFDPNFIAHSGLVATDVGSSLFIFLAVYFFWRVCRHFNASAVAGFAIVAALAQTTKFTAVVLLPMLAVIAVVEILRTRGLMRISISLGAAAIATIVALWAIYDFRFSAVPDPQRALAEEIAARKTLQIKALDAPATWPTGHLGVQDAVDRWEATRKLARESPQGYTDTDLRRAMRTTPAGLVGRTVLFAHAHRLLPESYLYGFAWAGATSVVRSAYLNGRYSIYGFPAYFIRTFLYKTPIPLIAAVLLGVPLALLERKRWADIAFLFWPALVYGVFAFASNLNIGHRHLFPLMPFVYTLCGSLGFRWRSVAPRARTAVAALVLIAIVLGPLVVFFPSPAIMINQHIAYLNEIAGGPVDGWAKLSDSNFDWGQDLKRLSRWVGEHHVREPIFLVYFGTADPRYYGIRYRDLRAPEMPTPDRPGYFAISQLDYLGILFDPQQRTFWRDYLQRVGAHRVGTAGYSIFIERIDHP